MDIRKVSLKMLKTQNGNFIKEAEEKKERVLKLVDGIIRDKQRIKVGMGVGRYLYSQHDDCMHRWGFIRQDYSQKERIGHRRHKSITPNMSFRASKAIWESK
jgi:hypothetical protein